MSDMPEAIWAWPFDDNHKSDGVTGGWYTVSSPHADCVEYIRSDLVESMQVDWVSVGVDHALGAITYAAELAHGMGDLNGWKALVSVRESIAAMRR